jgi:hypothetical protein
MIGDRDMDDPSTVVCEKHEDKEQPKGGRGHDEQVGGHDLARVIMPDLRSTYATRLSAGGVADEWVTQLLRQGDAKVFKKYSQMKLQMKWEAIQKLNRSANETGVLGQAG